MEEVLESETDFFIQSFNIHQRHLDYILSVNKNKSVALRMILDRDIKEQNHKSLAPLIDRVLVLSSFGFIVLMISYLMTGLIKILCLAVGCFLLFYSMTGGLVGAVQLSKKY